jgi:phosphoribosylformylglycinamidine cyclo-ligase
VFEWLAKTGAIDDANMYRTFNCGIGMVVIVAADQADRALGLLREAGELPLLIGEVRHGDRGAVIEA